MLRQFPRRRPRVNLARQQALDGGFERGGAQALGQLSQQPVAQPCFQLVGQPLALAPAALAAPVPQGSPVATAKRLVTRFFTLIHRKDVAALRTFVSPAFQLSRTDGSGFGKAGFLRDLPDIRTFRLSNFVATQAGRVLVTRCLANLTGSADGRPYKPGPAARLSVFERNGTAWRIVAHANFNSLTGGLG